jgi:two-component system NarL family sensor kinase
MSTELSSDGPSCEIRAPEPFPPLPAAAEVAAFRIAQEALTNVSRHAGARHARVSVSVGRDLLLEIEDDGRGLPSDLVAGVGLTSMRGRATELGGRFELSTPSAGGTLVRVWIPLPILP